MFMRLVGVASLFPPIEEHPTKGPHRGVNASTNDFPRPTVLHSLDEDLVGCGAIREPCAVQVIMHNGGWCVGAIRRNNEPERARDRGKVRLEANRDANVEFESRKVRDVHKILRDHPVATANLRGGELRFESRMRVWCQFHGPTVSSN